MTDESYSFTAAKTRLDEIVTQVRKKDTSLEKSLDLLEEGVRLANVCTELIDHADWASTPTTGAEVPVTDVDSDAAGSTAGEDVVLADGSENASADVETAESEDTSEPLAESDAVEASTEEAVGDVWSEDEAWADEAQDDPSDGDDGHGD